MLIRRFILSASALSFSWLSFAQEWSEFVSMEDRFRMFGPGQPEVEEVSYPSEYGVEYPARLYT